jgi:hypothetical protein
MSRHVLFRPQIPTAIQRLITAPLLPGWQPTAQRTDCTAGYSSGPPFMFNDDLGFGEFFQDQDLVLGSTLKKKVFTTKDMVRLRSPQTTGTKKERIGAQAHPTALTRQSRNQSSNRYLTTEPQSSLSSEFFIFKNSLLCALRASAVSSLGDRYTQNGHWKFCARRENFHG